MKMQNAVMRAIETPFMKIVQYFRISLQSNGGFRILQRRDNWVGTQPAVTRRLHEHLPR